MDQSSRLNQLLDGVKPIEEDEEAETLFDLAGYQVTKAELFSHTREPAIYMGQQN